LKLKIAATWRAFRLEVSWDLHSEGVSPVPQTSGVPRPESAESDHSLPFRNDGVDTQGTVERGRPPLPVRGERENSKMSLKFEHGTQLGLEGSVSRAPMFLEAVAFLPLLSFRSCVQGDLAESDDQVVFRPGWR